MLLSDISALHHTLISVGFIINTTNRHISLVAFTVFLQRRTSSFAEKRNFGTSQVTHIVIGYSVYTTYSAVETFTVVAMGWLRIRAFTFM